MAGGWSPPNNCQNVVCFHYNSVLNEKENNGSPPPQYEFHSGGTATYSGGGGGEGGGVTEPNFERGRAILLTNLDP